MNPNQLFINDVMGDRDMHAIKSTLEAKINILQKTRFNAAANILESFPYLFL